MHSKTENFWWNFWLVRDSNVLCFGVSLYWEAVQWPLTLVHTKRLWKIMRWDTVHYILANFQISERGTNERKKFKKRNIPKFPIHYYTKIAAKTGTHDKIILFFASKRGTVPPKEEQLASMTLEFISYLSSMHLFDVTTCKTVQN